MVTKENKGALTKNFIMLSGFWQLMGGGGGGGGLGGGGSESVEKISVSDNIMLNEVLKICGN